MDTLEIQDSFEPYYDGRKNAFSRVDPRAVDKASKPRNVSSKPARPRSTEPRDRAA